MKKKLLARLGLLWGIVSSRKINWVTVFGFLLVSWGIGMIFLPAGVIAGGISLLLLDWSVEVNGA